MHSFNELHLPWTNLADILTQGTSLPSFTTVWEELCRQSTKCSFNELTLPGMNSAGILAQGTSLPSFTMIREKSHPGER